MNALFNVSDRYAVVLLTYISQLATVYFGIKEFHEGTAMEANGSHISTIASAMETAGSESPTTELPLPMQGHSQEGFGKDTDKGSGFKDFQQ